MNIAFINGISCLHDAISTSVREQILWCKEAGHEVLFFGYACDYAELPFVQVANLADISNHPFYQACDLKVFHFGIYYPLFDLLLETSACPCLVVFHNVTPRHLLPPETRQLIDKSFEQMRNIAHADWVLCVSDENLRVLREKCIETPATTIPLPGPSDQLLPATKPGFVDNLVRLTFLGRFVTSKGPCDLLTALESVLAGQPNLQLRLDMMGNLNFSDPVVLDDMGHHMSTMKVAFTDRLCVQIHGNIPETAKRAILSEADIFILPTYHEGFCVPLLEAVASGCRIISYDNSNVPAVTGDLGELVHTGDIPALAQKIAEACADVTSIQWKTDGYVSYCRKAQAHLQNYSADSVRKKFLKLCSKVVSERLNFSNY